MTTDSADLRLSLRSTWRMLLSCLFIFENAARFSTSILLRYVQKLSNTFTAGSREPEPETRVAQAPSPVSCSSITAEGGCAPGHNVYESSQGIHHDLCCFLSD